MSYARPTDGTTASTSEESDESRRSSVTTEGDTTDGESGQSAAGSTQPRRDVALPLRAYKAVTVFSTLLAVLTIVAGFVALDVATNRGSADLANVDPVFALGGLATMLFGAAIYAFSTRFRAEGMGPAGGETDG